MAAMHVHEGTGALATRHTGKTGKDHSRSSKRYTWRSIMMAYRVQRTQSETQTGIKWQDQQKAAQRPP
jgi:hypothetical protein